jgi:hypothetical protein
VGKMAIAFGIKTHHIADLLPTIFNDKFIETRFLKETWFLLSPIMAENAIIGGQLLT